VFDRFQRDIRYLRISVTDACNLRCTYCMPAEGAPTGRHEAMLTFDEIEELVRVATELGVRKVRLTGGEPLLRPQILTLVRRLAAIPGIDDLALTTNGTLLARYALGLREAGLHRVNISLDSVDEARFATITRGGRLDDTLAGIEAALAAGFRQVKLNCVVTASPDEPDARAVAAFATARGLELRFIRQMNTERGEFWPIIGGNGGHCERCDRLRVSCDGKIFPCLFEDVSFAVRELGARDALLAAVGNKPEAGQRSRSQFYYLGG